MYRACLSASLCIPFRARDVEVCFAHADEWFRREATPAAFAVRSVFAGLIHDHEWLTEPVEDDERERFAAVAAVLTLAGRPVFRSANPSLRGGDYDVDFAHLP